MADPDEIQVSIFLEIAALMENEDVENVERVFVDAVVAIVAMMWMWVDVEDLMGLGFFDEVEYYSDLITHPPQKTFSVVGQPPTLL